MTLKPHHKRILRKNIARIQKEKKITIHLCGYISMYTTVSITNNYIEKKDIDSIYGQVSIDMIYRKTQKSINIQEVIDIM